MTIYDYWLNPLDPGAPSVTVLGFREDLEEFPHEIYSFFSSSIRDMDIKDVRLLWRWLQGQQQEFESIYGKILNLPLLYSPDYCPEDYLDYLAMNVGITSPDMDYLWGELTVIEKRRLIGTFVRALQLRGTQAGISRLVQSMTGQYAELREYFDYRWLISGDGEFETETALGYEDDRTVAGDPWLLSELSMPLGVVPDEIIIVTFPSYILYLFKVTSLINAIVDPPSPPNPPNVRMTYRPTKETTTGVVVEQAGDWFVVAPYDFKFGQTSSKTSGSASRTMRTSLTFVSWTTGRSIAISLPRWRDSRGPSLSASTFATSTSSTTSPTMRWTTGRMRVAVSYLIQRRMR
jgi:phage tail-like protein